MNGAPLPSAAGLAYRAAGPADGPPVLLVHGWPESSWMWRTCIEQLAAAGCFAVAPDLAGFGDSPPAGAGTWEAHVERLEAFVAELGLGPVALVVHDWGCLIGLRWACDHPARVRALVISNGGFFPDGKWHGFAQALRTPGDGEAIVEQFDRTGFAAVLRGASKGIDDRSIDEYWKAFGDAGRRRGTLELYRSGDFEKLEPYRGKLAGLAAPALVLWGADDPFAPVAGAHRLHAELPGSELVVLDGAGHFSPEDAPEAYAAEVVRFTGSL